MNKHKFSLLAALALSMGAAAQSYTVEGGTEFPAETVDSITFDAANMYFWHSGEASAFGFDERRRVTLNPRLLSDWHNDDYSMALERVGRMANLSDRYARYVMALPTNKQMMEAVAPWQKYFVYAPQYADSQLRNTAQNSKDGVTKAVIAIENPDSMAQAAPYDCLSPVVMNLNHQLRWHDEALTLDNFPFYKDRWPMLFTVDAELLENAAQVFADPQPTVMHNGAVYLTDNLPTTFDRAIPEEIRIEVEDADVLYQSELDDGKNSFVCPAPDDSIQEKYGRVSGGYRCMFKTNSSVNFTYKLPQVAAAKYDIYVVTVPYVVYAGGEGSKGENLLRNVFTPTINYIDKDGVEQEMQLENDTTSFDKCDTILLCQNFEFPVSYVGVDGAYPTLSFRVQNKRNTAKTTNIMCIDYLLLRRKD